MTIWFCLLCTCSAVFFDLVCDLLPRLLEEDLPSLAAFFFLAPAALWLGEDFLLPLLLGWEVGD